MVVVVVGVYGVNFNEVRSLHSFVLNFNEATMMSQCPMLLGLASLRRSAESFVTSRQANQKRF